MREQHIWIHASRHHEMVTSQAIDQDRVIFVHGTFAGDKNKSGNGSRWWQRGSECWQWFERNLPPGVSLPGPDERLFHWSGANTQTERLKASGALLAELMELERQGRRYHLVGHSHGGSVIWEALVTSELIRSRQSVHLSLMEELRRRGLTTAYRSGRRPSLGGMRAYKQVEREVRLDGLQSWTTLGTPFLHFLPKKRLFVRGVPHEKFSLAGSSDAEAVLFGGSMLLLAFAMVFWGSKSVDPSGTHLRPAYLVLAALSPVLAYLISRVTERRRLADAYKQRMRIGRRAMETFGSRWLGLWAASDEAIASLRKLSYCSEDHYEALCSGRSLKEFSYGHAVEAWWSPSALELRLSPPRRTIEVLAEPISKNRTPSSWSGPLYGLFNRFGAPWLARIVYAGIIRAAQGRDVPGAVMAYCSRLPVPVQENLPGLPGHVADELEAGVSESLRLAAPEARGLLVRAALDGLPISAPINLRGPLGGVLVHTSYFSNEQVLQLIADHIAWAYQRHAGSEQKMHSLANGAWLTGAKLAVSTALDQQVQLVKEFSTETSE